MSKIRKIVEPKPIVKVEPVKRVRPTEESKPVEKAEKPKKEVKKPVEPKKVEKPAEVKKPTAVKRPEKKDVPAVKPVIIEEVEINPELIKEVKKTKPKSDDKYIRYASKNYSRDKVVISEKLLKNEMKFAYFAIDGDDFYHYYILTKK